MNCPHQHHNLRKDLPPLTPRLAKLPVDERGYPVPFFVAYVDGKPEFRAADPNKLKACVKHRLCWVCGELLGKDLCFVIESDGHGGALFNVGVPKEVSYWREGRPATRAEILESIETGLPSLLEVCENEGQRREVYALRDEALKLVPK